MLSGVERKGRWYTGCAMCTGNSCRGLSVSECPLDCKFYKTAQTLADERKLYGLKFSRLQKHPKQLIRNGVRIVTLVDDEKV